MKRCEVDFEFLLSNLTSNIRLFKSVPPGSSFRHHFLLLCSSFSYSSLCASVSLDPISTPPLFLSRTTFDRFCPDWEHKSCGYGQALTQSTSGQFGQIPAALRAKSSFVASYVPGAVMKRFISVLHFTCQ